MPMRGFLNSLHRGGLCMWAREWGMQIPEGHLITMASQIASHGLGTFMSRKRLSVLMYAKLPFSTPVDLLALKANLMIYNSSDTLSCRFFGVLFWLQVLNCCCSSPADTAQKLPKAFFCK